MIELRPFAKLGGENHGWLDAKHHFSFANYHDPARMHWGNLRVWNDDTIAPGTGFPAHPHRDMEIVTYVRSGAITHRDSLGNEGRTGAGDVQVMSAGTGIRHSEWNAEDVPTTLFQIWIVPTRSGEAPGWGARPFPKGDRSGKFVVLASGQEGDRAGRKAMTRCRSAPMHACSARRSTPAKRSNIRWAATARATSCPRPARWRSKARASMRATVRRYPMSKRCA
jgi:quercetin 2,3-dioxygenase